MAEGTYIENGSHGPIIDELLCFILHKWGHIDVNTLTKLCVDSFDDKEIEASKDILFNLISDKDDTTLFKKRRAGKTQESKSVNNLLDICQLLEEKGNVKLPDFVALDLGKLPPISFDHIDVTVLLKRIENLSCTVKFVMEGMSKATDSYQNICEITTKLDSRMSKLESAEGGSKDVIYEEPSESNVDDCERVIDGIVDELPLLCNKCDLRFKTDTELSEHSISQHPNLNKLSCKECVFQSDSQGEMENHEAGHKPYACTICEFRSASCDELGIHMTAHIDERTFSCPECGNEFDNETNLKGHMNEHNEEKPNACYVCDGKFATRNELKLHLLTHNTLRTNSEPNNLQKRG